jgi:hypothetical protein
MIAGNFFSLRGMFFVGGSGWQPSPAMPRSGLRRRFFNLGDWRGGCMSWERHRPDRAKRVVDGLEG